MAERNGNGNNGNTKQDNWIVRTGKWIWSNKWTLLGAFATGLGAGFGGGKLLESHNAKKPGDDAPPQI